MLQFAEQCVEVEFHNVPASLSLFRPLSLSLSLSLPLSLSLSLPLSVSVSVSVLVSVSVSFFVSVYGSVSMSLSRSRSRSRSLSLSLSMGLCLCTVMSSVCISHTGWRRVIKYLIFICHFLQKSHTISGSFAKNHLQLGARQAEGL